MECNGCNIGLHLTFYVFFKTIPGNKVEKLRIYAIVIQGSVLLCYIEWFRLKTPRLGVFAQNRGDIELMENTEAEIAADWMDGLARKQCIRDQ